jgi:hypothetical protein
MSVNESRDELIEKIKNDMRKSGFPLEFHVLNVCSTKDTGRMPGLRYEFLEKQRELDLLCSFEQITLGPRKDATLQHTSTTLVIECKKRSDKPWVFISSPSYSFSNMVYHLKYTSEYNLYLAERQMYPLLTHILPMLHNNYYTDQSIPRCVSYYEAFSDRDKSSSIYKAIDSVISYILYRRESRIELQRQFGTHSEFYLPIVVLDGNLFEASIDIENIELNERAHVQLRTFHREDIYVIDVVTRDYFARLFDKVEAFHSDIVSAIRNLKFPAEFRTAAWANLKAMRNEVDDGAVLTAMIDPRQARQLITASKEPTPKRVRRKPR